MRGYIAKKKLSSSINLLIWTSFIGQYVHPVGGYGIGYSWQMGGIVILACCEYYFIRVHDNLVQHPSKNTSCINIDLVIKLYAISFDSR